MILIKRFGLIVASVLLLFLAWPPSNLGPLSFIAFVPLLFYLNDYNGSSFKKYLYSLLGIFIVLYVAAYSVSIYAWGEYSDSVREGVLIVTLPKAVIIALHSIIKNRNRSLILFVLLWYTVEILQLYWQFNAPLFAIGNSLSGFTSIIQHYSLWGIHGGTILILGVNVVIFRLIQNRLNNLQSKKLWYGLILFSLPFLLSPLFTTLDATEIRKEKVAIAVGHFDHFKIEFSENPKLLIDRYNALLKTKSLENVDLVIFPESAVVNGGWIENLNAINFSNILDSLCPDKEVFLGSHMFSIYKGNDFSDYRVRKHELSGYHFLSHNCIVFRNKLGIYSLRTKEKYIPFHESIPYPFIFGFAKGMYTKDRIPTYLIKYAHSHDEVFETAGGIKISPLMCFESTFTDMALRNPDADVILVLANESWNDAISGKEQYMSYLQAKAIESGKGILKVSNGGFSGFINSKGKIISEYGFDKPLVEVVEIELNENHSIYSSIGTFLSELIIFITVTLFVIQFILERRLNKSA